jgi:hypothetical protein
LAKVQARSLSIDGRQFPLAWKTRSGRNKFTASGFRLQFCVCTPVSTEEDKKQKHHVPQVGLQQVPVGWFYSRR